MIPIKVDTYDEGWNCQLPNDLCKMIIGLNIYLKIKGKRKYIKWPDLI